ncbi:probable cytochrome P450 313a4 [Culicoides brevitarsis]|uniref:probable cytochrome P450 313a4 n=1 Tax=Culicoides brevitarsis TaxID=469753 RepID=UPI00307B2645
MWLILVFVVIFLICLYLETQRISLNNRFKNISGPKQIPVFGSPYSIRVNETSEFKEVFEELFIDKVVKLIFGGKLLLLVSDPVVLSQVLPSKAFLDRPYPFDYFEFPTAMLSAKYPLWRPLRKQTNVCFNLRAISSMYPVLNKYANRLLTDLEPHIDGPTFDINQLTLRMGGAQVMENLMGISGEEFVIDPFAFDKMEDIIMGRMFNPLYQLWPIYRLSDWYKSKKIANETIHKFFGKIIDVKGTPAETSNGAKIFIDEMLRFENNGKKLYGKDLSETVGLMYLAAFETSALTVSYACLMMALHPEYDAKLAQEIQENYHENEEIDSEMLKKFPYLDMVVKETLRHFPSVPLTARQCMEDCQVDPLGVIPKGTILVFNFWKLHRWPEFWGPDAKKFNPDNFLPENVAARHPYAHLPFSSGPRNCVGMNYALASIKVGLIKVLAKYRFTSKLKLEEFQFKASITLKLVGGHQVQVHRR